MRTWHACINMIPLHRRPEAAAALRLPLVRGDHNELRPAARAFPRRGDARSTTPESATLAPVVVGALEQAKRDLAALRLYDLDHGERAWTMAAGLPIYIALFGRDTLTAAWQAALASPDMMRGTLPELARWQGRDDERLARRAAGPDAARGAHRAAGGAELQPARALLRLDHDLGLLTRSPSPSCGTGRATRSWSARSRAGAEGAALARRVRATCDGDGFYEYQTRSTQGVKHQGWKDSRRRDRLRGRLAGRAARSRPARSRASPTWPSCTCRKCCGGSARRTRRSGSTARRAS